MNKNKIWNSSHHQRHTDFLVLDKPTLNRICRTLLWLFFMLRVMLIGLSRVHMTNQWSENCLLFPPCVLYKPRNHYSLEQENWYKKHEGFEDERSSLCPLFGTVHHHKGQTDWPNTCLLQGCLVSLHPNLTATCRRWDSVAVRETPNSNVLLSFCGQAGWSSMSSGSNSHCVTD